NDDRTVRVAGHDRILDAASVDHAGVETVVVVPLLLAILERADEPAFGSVEADAKLASRALGHPNLDRARRCSSGRELHARARALAHVRDFVDLKLRDRSGIARGGDERVAGVIGTDVARELLLPNHRA